MSSGSHRPRPSREFAGTWPQTMVGHHRHRGRCAGRSAATGTSSGPWSAAGGCRGCSGRFPVSHLPHRARARGDRLDRNRPTCLRSRRSSLRRDRDLARRGDRSLLDERHARLVGTVAGELGRAAWAVELEVTFNQYGDRGSIDILALRSDQGSVLVVEIKTQVTSVDETIRRLDVKERLAPRIVQDRWGWRPRTVSRLLVILDTATNRRRVATHDGTLGLAFRDRGVKVRRWIREPSGRLAGLRFSSITSGRGSGGAPEPSGSRSAPNSGARSHTVAR